MEKVVNRKYFLTLRFEPSTVLSNYFRRRVYRVVWIQYIYAINIVFKAILSDIQTIIEVYRPDLVFLFNPFDEGIHFI